ncbi:MAG: aldose epimerase family protein [Cyclobacteriaceae bacterium]
MSQTSSRDSIKSFVLTNSHKVKIEIINFGGRVVSLFVPDKNGKLEDVVLGFDSLEKYTTHDSYYGAIIGRYGNRIANGKFSLREKEYQLEKNNGVNALHGGPKGFHNVFWKVISSTDSSVAFSYISKDGEEGYPGNVNLEVKYMLTNDNELIIDYSATSDKETIINLTNHSFFNLNGEGKGDVLNHQLMINAERFCPVDQTLIPSGELKEVKGSPFDFLETHKIGERIDQNDQQLKFGNGYDHNWVLNKKADELTLAAKVIEPNSGRVMEVLTTEPGIQFYSGNFLDGKEIGKGGKPYQFRSAFCLETQHFPDSPNHSNFPSVILKPGEVYRQKTIYKFSAQ